MFGQEKKKTPARFLLFILSISDYLHFIGKYYDIEGKL